MQLLAPLPCSINSTNARPTLPSSSSSSCLHTATHTPRRGVLFGANLNRQELQQQTLALENEAMRERLQAASQVATSGGFGCAVCMDDFNDSDRAPRNLSCGHCSCTLCLTNMSFHGSVACPQCRAVTRLPSGGSTGFAQELSAHVYGHQEPAASCTD